VKCRMEIPSRQVTSRKICEARKMLKEFCGFPAKQRLGVSSMYAITNSEEKDELHQALHNKRSTKGFLEAARAFSIAENVA